MTPPALDLQNITVWRDDQRALRGVTLRVAADERVALLGANGAGKSTLLEILTGTFRPAFAPGARARLFGEKFWSLEDLRGRMGMLIPGQSTFYPKHELAGDVVLSNFRKAFGRTTQMEFSDMEEEAARTAMVVAGVVHLANRDFFSLSSGEKTRFLLARALVHDPQFLVLDEPCTALDFPGSRTLLKTIGTLALLGKGLLLVTHEVREIIPEIDRVILLKNGRILADGPKKEVLTSELLSVCYGCPIELRSEGDSFHLRPG